KTVAPGNVSRQPREIESQPPARRSTRSIIDVGVPMAAGKLGTVRVGMDRTLIDQAAAASGRRLLLVFGGVAVLAVLLGAILAQKITRPIAQLVAAARRGGEGDLRETVSVTSRDQIGELAHPFNDPHFPLRSPV